MKTLSLALVALATFGLHTTTVVAQTPSQVLLRSGGATPIEITALDFEADAVALPLDARHYALSDSDKIEVVGQSLLVRATLAERARALGLDQNALVQAQLRQAQDNVLMRLLMEQELEKSRPDEAALLAYAEAEYKYNPERFNAKGDERSASHILIVGTDDAAKSRIDAIYQRIQDGEDFGNIAFSESADPTSAARYGSLGYFPRGRMVAELEAELDKLEKPGQITLPFLSEFGWHIARLDDQREAGVLPFETVKAALIAEGAAKAEQDARNTLVNALMAEAQPDSEAIAAFAEKNRELAGQVRAAQP